MIDGNSGNFDKYSNILDRLWFLCFAPLKEVPVSSYLAVGLRPGVSSAASSLLSSTSTPNIKDVPVGN